MDGERDPQKVLEVVATLVHEVIDDGGLGPPIAMETSFNADLELESIEFVALAEKLQERYGEAVDFAGWLAGMELDAILALRVGDLVRFIVDKLGG
jgi:acyl carrier protein